MISPFLNRQAKAFAFPCACSLIKGSDHQGALGGCTDFNDLDGSSEGLQNEHCLIRGGPVQFGRCFLAL